jgi:hypothetical protein
MLVIQKKTEIIETKQIKFVDRIKISKDKLLNLAEIKKVFKDYNHDDLERYKKSMVWHDVGSLFFMIYLSKKYKVNSIDTKSISNISKETNLLKWLEEVDYSMDEDTKPLFLIYFKNKTFYYDSNLFTNISHRKINIFILSHTFSKGSGHLGCLFIYKQKAFYYDPNGNKDSDDKEYYLDLLNKLDKEMKKYNIELEICELEKGIQYIQEAENSRYNLNIMGMCSCWTFLMIELKILNPELTIQEIERNIKKKYKNKLTRMIVTYQQEIHPILWGLAKQFHYFNQKDYE